MIPKKTSGRALIMCGFGILISGCSTTNLPISYPEPYATQIREIQAQNARLATNLDSKTLDIRRPGVDLQAWVSSRVVARLLDDFNAIPSSHRRVKFTSYAASGRYAGDEGDCGIFGRASWYVAPRGGSGHDFTLNIGKASYAWQDNQGFAINLPVWASARSNLHYHVDPCIGGGFGWDGEAAAVSSTITLNGVMSLTEVTQGQYSLSLKLTGPRSILLLLAVRGLPIPFVPIVVDAPHFAEPLFLAKLSPLFSETGSISIPGQKPVKYKLNVTTRQVSNIDEGFEARFDVVVSHSDGSVAY
ncbi:hypothetical protein [Microvirga sp. KLBC 81]|uniref:hypothetical protein n=1 Tax=Microvirga sp. KLBC 81 TaxID=1862707 RepID=UPI0010581F0C|nr:hypothetical protein [Microvirga sp. KLBC 81]